MQIEPVKSPGKNQRIATRVTNEHKSLFEQAARMRGLSLTDFMVNAAYNAAIETLRDSQTILELGPEDTKVFIENLLKPESDPATEIPNLYKAVQQNKPVG